MKTIAFIGAGNMNGAIISGLVHGGFIPENIMVSNPSAPKREALQAAHGILQTQCNIEAAKFADVIVLGVKPHFIGDVCQQLGENLDLTGKCFISVAAGCTIKQIEQALNQPCTVIRTMPNTPSQLGFGVTGIYANELINDKEKAFTTALMESVGIIKWLESEQQIDHIIAVSGSGPAYFFLFMEAMEKQAKAYGFSEQDSRELVQQTALGAAKMVTENKLSISKLRENVCSKGGTTQAAISAFSEGGLEQLVTKAMDTALNRAKEMAQKA
ncbi:pyrroline-5-carboxylate reductase [Colwellia sp. M166]|jgi:pyrroline-5-carboxylate reductase|uniref:pyrroline-5-carboxylate reductase n=1 Tax=Colwellia sp. M166 TaxID=2583805 RepID=UPI00211EA69E|nr:pyrroline-5-carboxylate reductase [Colwellia sp. M166]UUO24892.1 pyrroline-5-carboxylate reductase [Colwellia sp. M166]|tara:strand:- start:4265 stop:5077 length:813 start_codon:yes stop_codon:yes gene_type:complete